MPSTSFSLGKNATKKKKKKKVLSIASGTLPSSITTPTTSSTVIHPTIIDTTFHTEEIDSETNQQQFQHILEDSENIPSQSKTKQKSKFVQDLLEASKEKNKTQEWENEEYKLAVQLKKLEQDNPQGLKTPLYFYTQEYRSYWIDQSFPENPNSKSISPFIQELFQSRKRPTHVQHSTKMGVLNSFVFDDDQESIEAILPSSSENLSIDQKLLMYQNEYLKRKKAQP